MQALRRLGRWALCLVLSGSFVSCSYVSRREFEAYKETTTDELNHARAEVQALKYQAARDRALMETEIRKVASRAACDNNQLRDFLRECEEGSEVCSDKGVEGAWKFISSQLAVQLFLRPRATGKNIVLTRRGQMLSTFDTKTWLPSTRFLILVLPRKDTDEIRDEALKVGREVAHYLDTLFEEQKGIKILGPKILPCKMKVEEIAKYLHSELDVPVKGEPKGYEPTVRVFIFKTDC